MSIFKSTVCNPTKLVHAALGFVLGKTRPCVCVLRGKCGAGAREGMWVAWRSF